MKVHVRRVGLTAGFLFGFGLLTVVLASNASADERPDPGGVTELLSPVVRSGTEALAPAVRPITEAVAPITEPVLRPVFDAVTPVLDTVAPVTEPLVGPLLRAADPVIEPVAEATGLTPAVSAVSGERPETVVPQERALPVPVAVPAPAPVLVAEAAPARPTAPLEMPVVLSPVDQALMVGSGVPGDLPVGPVNDSALGTSGSIAGSGHPHSADAAVSASAGPLSDDKGGGRSPPGTIVGQPWFGYDDRDYPS